MLSNPHTTNTVSSGNLQNNLNSLTRVKSINHYNAELNTFHLLQQQEYNLSHD